MSQIVLLKAQSLLRSGDILGAENVLTFLAEEAGDQALVRVLDSLSSADLLAIIREYDASRLSIISLLVTPEQFASAIVLEHRYNDVKHERLRAMINAVIFRDGADASVFLQALVNTDGGCDVLVNYLIDKIEFILHFVEYKTFDIFKYDDGRRIQDVKYDWSIDLDNYLNVDLDETNDRDWMELTCILHHHLPEVFTEVLSMLKTKVTELERQGILTQRVLREKIHEVNKETETHASIDGEESAL